ncbi:MAG TPA: ABC-type transport auxiliary lipoprotein family protein [Steroidobacteraceae bacterium]|nr:ABC-type transport auxiliary lipoprotein family protein [Steroidobacteraceae bacterium]
MSRPAMARTGLAGALACTLAACGTSAPVRYFTLEAVSGAVITRGGGPVQVGVVHLPEVLDRRGLTHASGPGELAVADSALWAAPLPDLVRDTLRADLGQRLGYERLARTDAPPTPATRLVAVDFPLLSADEHCSVRLLAAWTITAPEQAQATAGAVQGPAGDGEVRGSLETTAAAAACPEGLPAALSAALGRVSDGIAAALGNSKP